MATCGHITQWGHGLGGQQPVSEGGVSVSGAQIEIDGAFDPWLGGGSGE